MPMGISLREIVYDSAFHTYAEQETVYLGSNSAPLVARAAHHDRAPS